MTHRWVSLKPQQPRTFIFSNRPFLCTAGGGGGGGGGGPGGASSTSVKAETSRVSVRSSSELRSAISGAAGAPPRLGWAGLLLAASPPLLQARRSSTVRPGGGSGQAPGREAWESEVHRFERWPLAPVSGCQDEQAERIYGKNVDKSRDQPSAMGGLRSKAHSMGTARGEERSRWGRERAATLCGQSSEDSEWQQACRH